MTQHNSARTSRPGAVGAAVPRVWMAAMTAWMTLTLAASWLLGWLRGDQPVDDRGSDSTEKAFMVILGITLATLVTAAAGAFIATKTSLFK